MSPFLQTPEGFSPETLELLDHAFAAAWQELQTKKSSATSTSDGQTTCAEMGSAVKELPAVGVPRERPSKSHRAEAARALDGGPLTRNSR